MLFFFLYGNYIYWVQGISINKQTLKKANSKQSRTRWNFNYTILVIFFQINIFLWILVMLWNP